MKSISKIYSRVKEDFIGGTLSSPDERRDKSSGKTFVLTAIQNNTHLHEEFWKSLQQYVKVTGAELHISRFSYVKSYAVGEKTGTDKSDDYGTEWYDPRTAPYWSDKSIELAPGLVWCGELNVLPTRVNPISGFETYGRTASIVMPHAKMAMRSVPTMKPFPPKFVYTTGALTQRNYIQRAAGQKADFHHVFGALIVEVDEHGEWWARQINADKSGSFYDLHWKYTPTGREFSVSTAAITHGDIHGYKLDPEIAECVWKDGGVVDTLFPQMQFFHDTIDFAPRNHHNIDDPMHLHKMHVDRTASVEHEFTLMAEFLLTFAGREWAKSYLVVSNHDQAIKLWLKNTKALQDPPNLRTWLKTNLYMCEVQESGGVPEPFVHMMRTKFVETGVPEPLWPEFILEDESFLILDEIEAGLHGHLGPNGARGTPTNLRTVGKANTGHTHTAGIVDGVYTAGVYGKLDMGYNKGPSSWSHSFIITYANGKRCICTIKKGKAWR